MLTTRTNVKSSSTCQPPETVQGTHVFEILGYSKHRGMGAHFFVRSAIFDVAGYNWVIFFYPDGFGDEIAAATAAAGGFDLVSAYLRLVSTGCGKVRASCDLRLINPATGSSTSAHPALITTREFDPDSDGGSKICHCLCIARSELEGTYLKDDRLVMECVVTVRKEPKVSKSKTFPSIKVPPSNLKRQLASLLESREGSDVTFTVAGETFAAHRLVLALRSPVFKAELCGPMRESSGTQHPIVIEDMQPDVFRAMLYFIYTDSMDYNDDLKRDYHSGNCDMVRHLLVAADRYAVERLKMTCQSILCNNLHVRNVATTLALADQHHCDRLKNACIEFMCCSSDMDAIVATQGFKDLTAASPSVLAEAMVRMSKVGKKLTKRALKDESN
jgi:speckle-type POZ protein